MKSMKSKRTGDVDGRIQAVLKFERFFARRLREAAKAAAADRELNDAQREILHEGQDGPVSPSWLSWRLGLDRSARLSRGASVRARERDKEWRAHRAASR